MMVKLHRLPYCYLEDAYYAPRAKYMQGKLFPCQLMSYSRNLTDFPHQHQYGYGDNMVKKQTVPNVCSERT